VGIELGGGDRHVVNRLRWHLLELCPELERSTGRSAFNRARVLDRVDRWRLVEPRTKRITGGGPSRKAKNHALSSHAGGPRAAAGDKSSAGQTTVETGV
jgi:hypothetical protein